MTANKPLTRGGQRREKLARYLAQNWQLYLLLLSVVAYYIIFHYMPMLGIQIAFRNYSPRLGFWHSKWVGLAHLNRFFRSYYAMQVIQNTLLISVYSLIVGMPLPILLAIFMNEVRCKWFKRTVQTVTYLPHFLSWVIVVGLAQTIFSSDGIVNELLLDLGIVKTPVFFLGEGRYFWWLVGVINV